MKKEYRMPIMCCDSLCQGLNIMQTINPSNHVQEDDPESQYHGFAPRHL